MDVDAIRASGRFSDAELLAAACDRDGGFDVGMFARQLDQVQRLLPEQVSEYGVDSNQLTAVKKRLTDWAAKLRASLGTSDEKS